LRYRKNLIQSAALERKSRFLKKKYAASKADLKWARLALAVVEPRDDVNRGDTPIYVHGHEEHAGKQDTVVKSFEIPVCYSTQYVCRLS
jgi:hypothetical protein